jgi:general secretion pathway protein G
MTLMAYRAPAVPRPTSETSGTSSRSSQAHKLTSSPAGFTLIELLVVIVIIGLLAGLVAPQVLGRISEAKSETARTQIEMLSVALDNYRLDNGSYPTTEQGLEALRTAPTREPVSRNWRGPYLRKEVPLDPWDRPYVYKSPGEQNKGGFDLLSLGRDGRPGGEDEDADILSWKR